MSVRSSSTDRGPPRGEEHVESIPLDELGGPGTLRLAEVAKPAHHAHEVLVRVLAVSVNPADWHSLRGKPVFARATLGLLRPKNMILGVDIAGQVEAVGTGVTRF